MKNNLFKILINSLIKLPTPINISIWWNFGSLLGLCMIIQILSGIFLSFHYCANIYISFNSIIHIMNDINYGWMIRLIHMNGASMFFLFLYIHIFRGIYYCSYILMNTWMIGTIILLMIMMTAFMGYVLPWGQMSFWGATVITNLLSAIPYLGNMIVEWLWGGFSINNPTLNRFYSLHFMLPFIILFLIIFHLMFLHETGSNNPMGLNSNYWKIKFHLYFTIKDLLIYMIMIMMFILICLINPYMLNDPENFIMANSMITPIHIQPEWYFLFAYAILRSIPNKLGGVMALLFSILILMILPFLNKMKIKSFKFYFFNQILFFIFFNITILLTWIGMKSIEYPFILIGQILTILYFMYFFFNYYLMKMWNNLIY
uniref:Cytochrome b n=1 Tax=Trichopria drosophilae TaxID=1507179 RepID=A0A6M3HRL2_9HYME|nr:cytochrome b [Trichopria drosophilae]QIV21178.1 cytochrome b [Trichopria drosophilae]